MYTQASDTHPADPNGPPDNRVLCLFCRKHDYRDWLPTPRADLREHLRTQ